MLSANIRIKLYCSYSSQPPLLPVQIVQNWQVTNMLASCDSLEPGGHSAMVIVVCKLSPDIPE